MAVDNQTKKLGQNRPINRRSHLVAAFPSSFLLCWWPLLLKQTHIDTYTLHVSPSESTAMAHFGLWVAVLAASFIAAVADSPPGTVGPQPDMSFICRRFGQDREKLSVGEVFNMVFIIYQNRFQSARDITTDSVTEFMNYADDDHDNFLNMSECEKLLQYLNKKWPLNLPGPQ
ncbi:hypothetical protein MHYP_G00030790 [Metynnis hypsauchen]